MSERSHSLASRCIIAGFLLRVLRCSVGRVGVLEGWMLLTFQKKKKELPLSDFRFSFCALLPRFAIARRQWDLGLSASLCTLAPRAAS